MTLHRKGLMVDGGCMIFHIKNTNFNTFYFRYSVFLLLLPKCQLFVTFPKVCIFVDPPELQ